MSPRPRKYHLKGPQVLKALEDHHGNLSATARFLGVSRPTLDRAIKSYGLGERVLELRIGALWRDFKSGMGPDVPC